MTRFRPMSLVAAMFASLWALSVDASALTMKATYSGYVFSSSDLTNMFGSGGGSSMDGLPYTLSFTYDPLAAGVGRNTSSVLDNSFGGTATGFTSPIVAAALTINGHREQVSGSYTGYIYNFESFFTTQFAEDYANDGILESSRKLQGFAYDFSLGIPVNLGSAFDVTPEPRLGTATFSFSSIHSPSQQQTVLTYGNLKVDRLSVRSVSAVPLPATLPLLASAVGALAVSRRKKKRLTRR